MTEKLRKKAENRLQNEHINLTDLTQKEVVKLAHELQVHQIELEMQNQELQETLTALEISRRRFYDLFHLAPTGYVVLNENAVIQQANQRFAETVGVEYTDLEEKNFQDFIFHEERDPFLARYRAFYKEPKNKKYELNLWSKKMGKITVQIEGVILNPAYSAAGSKAQLLMTITDIGLIKQAQLQSQLSEARLQSLFRISQYIPKNLQDLLDYSLSEAIQLTNSKFGYLYYYHEEKQQFELNSWSKEVMPVCEIIEPQTIYDLETTGLWGEAVRQRKPIVVNDFQAENPLKKGYPEGHVKLSKFLTLPIIQQNKIVAVVGVANKPSNYDVMDIRQLQLLMDSVWKIVEKQQVEEKLLAQEEQFSNLFSNMQEGVALHELIINDQGETSDYRIININRSYEKIIGLTKGDVVGKLSTEVYQTAEPPYLHQYKQVVLSGIPDQFEVFFEPLEKNFGISIVPWGKYGFATIFSDITPRKLYEQERDSFIHQLEDKNAELERFTYTVSHDLKSPLITIKGFLGMLEEDIQEGDLDQAYADMQRIHSAADKMKSLLDNLLDLSRVGRVSNDFELININTLISETIEILSPMIMEKKVKLIIPPELPALYGDRARLAEVFQNLIENSLKYLGEPAEPTIQINAVKNADDVLVSIKDNGIGIETQYQQKIFGLFEKLDSRSMGTGVGLALVKRIIEHHGGTIWVQSAGNNQGSEFCFRLPLQKNKGGTGD